MASLTRSCGSLLSASFVAAGLLGHAHEAYALDGPGPDEPLAGISGDQAFLRSADNTFVLLPSGRLQVDTFVYDRPTSAMPNNTVLLRRARLELAGWIGEYAHYSIAGDFAASPPAGADPQPQSFIAATDDYVGVASPNDLVIFQLGQFDAPFTFENRVSDKYIDFMERSITVRALAVPSNKEVGAMLHGVAKNRLFYYSLGLFNGDGQNFKNLDADADFLARAWVTPLATTKIDRTLHLSLGGSAWVGTRGPDANILATQATQGNFAFLTPKWTLPDGVTPAELHQRGDIDAVAFEVNAPILHKGGVRFEYVHKSQGLAEDDVSAASSGKVTVLGRAQLTGSSYYAELWGWILGDDRFLPEPGLELPTRLRSIGTMEPKHGLMLAARVDSLQETITSDTPSLADPNVGKLSVVAPEVGINYWYTKRFRASFNYVANIIDGKPAAAALVKNGGVAQPDGTVKGGNTEHEFLFRLGIAL